MDNNMNDIEAHPERRGDEDLPLIPMSPALNRSHRAKALSQLSLHSEGSLLFDATFDDALSFLQVDETVEHPDKLHLASWCGDEKEVRNMINKADVNQLDKSGRTALHNAILGGHVNIVEILLEAGANTTLLDRSQEAPLHTAVRTGNENLVKAFLSREDCNPDITGKASQTPLHIAAKMDKVSICKVLIDHGASPDCRDDEEMTPLTRAVEQGACTAAELLFEDAKTRDKEMVKEVLTNVDSDGSTLLHLAVDSESCAVVKLCLKNGSIIRQPKDHDRSTAFHLACAVGALEIVKLFASKDPKICRITLIDAQGWTPLHLAALNNHPYVLKYLLEQGALVDPRDKLRRTPLFLAAENGGTEAAKVLIDNGADVTAKDVDLRSCVRVAVGHTATMTVLLTKREAIPLITDKDITGFAPVHYAAKYGNLQNILLFMKRNKAATIVTSDALDTALHGAARYGWLEIVDALLSGRNVRSINVKNNQGKTALHFACAEGHDQVVELLLKLGATVQSDHSDRTALHVAAMRGSTQCVKYLLQYQPQCINHLDKHQNTALHLAAIHGHPDIISCLLACKEQEILQNSKNQNALDAAMEAERKTSLLAIASQERWRELLMSSAPGHMSQMQVLVVKFPEVATRFLDQCIINEGNPDGEDYTVTYDLSLIQGKQKRGQDYLMVLKTMLKHQRISCLTHPICFIAMSTKWKFFGWKTITINMILYLLFVIPLTVLAVTERANEKRLCNINESWTRKDYINLDVPCRQSDKVTQFLLYFVAIITMVHAMKKLFQLKMQKKRYLVFFSHYLEWIAYVSALAYIFPACDCKLGYKQEVGAIALFFGWVNLILFLRRISSYGRYIIMLTTMFVTLFKVLLLFVLFVMTFSSAFYLLMDETQVSFATFPTSMMTVFVMTLGEMSYEDRFMPWDSLEYATLANILFLMFVLGMPIILMNMLVGLAVGDIDKIQAHAAIDRYMMQVELVLDMEEMLPACLAKRAHVTKQVVYPNRDASKLYDRFLGFSPPGDEKQEDEASPEHMPLLDKMKEQEERINGIYELLKEQSAILKSLDPARKRKGQDVFPFGV
ncbi:transient receptor potential cation channel subfamily A member 1-like [Porites lutea]